MTIKTIKVNLEDCIGCGVCMQVCPNVFNLDEYNGKALLVSEDAPEDEKESVKEAIDSCPIGCINE